VAAVRRVTREQVLRFRLVGHHLGQRRPPGDLVVVAGACGIRNTPPGSAPLALGARVADLSMDAVDDALSEQKSLVEALSMRISPHIVPARDLAVFTLGALPRSEASLRVVLANHTGVLDKAGMTATEALDLATDAAQAELGDGMLSRGALSAGMTRRLPAALNVACRACRSTHVQESLFRLVGVRGVFVIVRMGRENLYAPTDQWLGAAPGGEAVAARTELLRRYLACFGPSTAEQFAAWIGMAASEARDDWTRLAEQLVEVSLDGQRAFLHGDDLAHLERPTAADGARLLPPYDAYLDQRDRATLLPDKALHRRVWTVLGNPGVVVDEGQIVGTWRPQKKGKRLGLNVEAFGPLAPETRDEIEAEAALLAPLRGCTSASVTFSE
jgi:hypothetical protein